MYEISIEEEFSAAHRLREYEGNCERLHGHNWRVIVSARARELDRRGLAIDFKLLKRIVRSVISALEHRLLNEIPPFDQLNPTCENIARHICLRTESELDLPHAWVAKVEVWESARSRCTYYHRMEPSCD